MLTKPLPTMPNPQPRGGQRFHHVASKVGWVFTRMPISRYDAGCCKAARSEAWITPQKTQQTPRQLAQINAPTAVHTQGCIISVGDTESSGAIRYTATAARPCAAACFPGHRCLCGRGVSNCCRHVRTYATSYHSTWCIGQQHPRADVLSLQPQRRKLQELETLFNEACNTTIEAACWSKGKHSIRFSIIE